MSLSTQVCNNTHMHTIFWVILCHKTSKEKECFIGHNEHWCIVQAVLYYPSSALLGTIKHWREQCSFLIWLIVYTTLFQVLYKINAESDTDQLLEM